MIFTDHSKKMPLENCMFKVFKFIDGYNGIDWIAPYHEESINSNFGWISYTDLIKLEGFKYPTKLVRGYKKNYKTCKSVKTVISKIENSRNL